MLTRIGKQAENPPKKTLGVASPRLLGLAIGLSILSTSVANANVVGSDTQNFNPTTSGLDFVTVHSSETLEPGFVNFGLYVNQAVNSLPYFDDSDQQGRTRFSDSLIGADINVGIGLLPGFDIGVSLPQVLTQRVESEGYHGQFSRNGNTEMRFNAKYRLWGESDYGIAVVASANLNRIKNNPYVGKDAGPTKNLELVGDTTIGKVALGLNLGRRWRQAGSVIPEAAPIEPLADQWIASGAMSYLFSSIDTKLIFEIFGSKPVEKDTEASDRLASTAEALVGIKHDFTSSLAGHLGGGTELVHGRGSPDWRIYAGLNWAIGPTYSKPKEPARIETQGKPATFSKKDPFAGPPRPKEKIVIHDILFEFDSDSLVLGGANDTLARLVKYLLIKPQYTRLVIEGHTDSVGSDEYNLDLSRRRAATIRKWLISRFKLDPTKVEAVGRGERMPIADNGNFQGRQLNRRVEFTIYRAGATK